MLLMRSCVHLLGLSLGLTLTLFGASQPIQNKKIAVCVQGSAAGLFWNHLRQGIEQAGREWDAKPIFYGLYDYNIENMPQYIMKAIQDEPDGLIVSIPYAQLIGPPVRSALKKGIPVIAVYSGDSVFQELGIKKFIGMCSKRTGMEVADRLLKSHITSLLCITDEEQDLSKEETIQGLKRVFADQGKHLKTLTIRNFSPATASAAISTALLVDTNIDGILALNGTAALATIMALQENEAYGKIKMATFDFSPHIRTGIEMGNILFAVTQQPFIQGYLAMSFLSAPKQTNEIIFFDRLNQLGIHNFYSEGTSGPILYTGPVFITSENIASFSGNF